MTGVIDSIRFLKGALRAFCLLASSCACAASNAETGGSGILVPGTNVEVVVSRSAQRTTLLAAAEMTNYLSRVFSKPVPLAHAPTAGRASIVLGSNTWSDAAGIPQIPRKRDSFSYRVDGENVYLKGRDDSSKYAMDAYRSGNTRDISRHEMGTLFAVYWFLEEFAGCRFYFPGKHGTIVPVKEALSVPRGFGTREPDFAVRSVYMTGDGGWPDGTGKSTPCKPKTEQWMRLRLQTEEVPCCHGLIYAKLPERFGAEHPEWFQLSADGRRCVETAKSLLVGRQFCHTSAIWNEIYLDAKAYFLGLPPESRNLQAWSRNTSGGKYFDVMLQDGFRECFCTNCQSRYDKSVSNYATELIWERTAEVARRLKADGIAGHVTQMAYWPYNGIPKVEIPENVLVMVAEHGPFSVGKPKLADEYEHIRAWTAKLNGRKVWLWNYPSKLYARAFKNIPQMCPRAWGRYYQGIAPCIFGAFAESESDRPVFNYLNYYVFSRIGWDSTADIESIIDEHHRLMFGDAAPEMKKFYDSLERHWMREISGTIEQSPFGPVAKAPSFAEVWRNVYNAREIDRLERLFASGRAKLRAGSPEADRLEYVKEQLFDPMAKDGRSYLDGISVAKALARRASERHPRPSLIENGSLDSPGGWRFAKEPGSSYVYDTACRVTGEASLKIECNGSARAVQPLDGRLKPAARYRLSYFIRLQDVQPLPGWSGVVGEFCDGENWFHYPDPPLKGSSEWMYQESTFSTPARGRRGGEQRFQFLLKNVKGTVWFDDVRLEELPGAEANMPVSQNRNHEENKEKTK